VIGPQRDRGAHGSFPGCERLARDTEHEVQRQIVESDRSCALDRADHVLGGMPPSQHEQLVINE
jgi:hypothetical protein